MRAMRLRWSLLGAGRLPETSRSKLRVLGLLYFCEGSPVGVLFLLVRLIASWLWRDANPKSSPVQE